MVTHYIYIPGLGDKFDSLRHFALRRWHRRDTRTTLVPMRWADASETYEQKYERVADVIRSLDKQDIVLVGESAGGSMALLAYSRLPERIKATITICGYNHDAGAIHPYHHKRHPAFYKLVQEIDKVLPDVPTDLCRRITTIYSTKDHVVTEQHSKIAGARAIVVHTPGHFRSIARILLIGLRNLDKLGENR